MLLELVLPLPEAPAPVLPAFQAMSAPTAQVPLDSPAWCYRGLLVCHIPMSPRACSLVRLWCPCPACALNFCHTSPL